MGKKMKNAPVYFTVTQVRFNPVLNIEGYLTTIQDSMRIARFPDFKRVDLKQLIVPFGSAGDGGQPPAPVFVPQSHCIFGNMEGTTEFVLQTNALALQTTAYETFETFLNVFSKGLIIVNDALKLDFTERIGLRYLDAVLPGESESLSDYLTVEVLGLSKKLDREILHTFHETVSTNLNGQLISRVIIQKGRVGLPPEVSVLPPEVSVLAPRVNPRFTQQEGLHAIVDTDAFIELREPFDAQKIESKLNTFHDEINTSFEATVTPYALGVWA
jgi:uncharacterized protein (TIGR04255 family)